MTKKLLTILPIIALAGFVILVFFYWQANIGFTAECQTDKDCSDTICPMVVGGDTPKCAPDTNECYCGGVCGDNYCDSYEERSGTCPGDCLKEGIYFSITACYETFNVLVTDTETIKKATKEYNGEINLVPIGDLAYGDGGFNYNWSWHLIPDTVRMGELAIELCDGCPSFVEADVDYWINNVGQFCPWSGNVTGICGNNICDPEEKTYCPEDCENLAPILDPIGNKTVNEEELLTFTISAIDPDKDPLTYSAQNLPRGAIFKIFNSTTRIFSWTPSDGQAASYQVAFTVSDGSLSDSEIITITVLAKEEVPKQIPIAIINSISPNPALEGKTVTFQGSGTDTDGSITGYSWRSSIDGQLSTQATFITSNLSVGTHAIYFKVKDNDDAWSSEIGEILTITLPETTEEKPVAEITITELKAKIQELLTQITLLQTELAKLRVTQDIPSSYQFTKTLWYGQKNQDVRYLQVFLKSHGAEIYPEGLVTSYFGALTKKAVIRFQEKYTEDILSPWRLTKGTGIVGETTRAKMNELLK